jgi:hypothetical protein
LRTKLWRLSTQFGYRSYERDRWFESGSLQRRVSCELARGSNVRSVPLGYDADERTLVINPAEAETVRRIFALYREFGCVRRVKEEADRLGLRTKCRTAANGIERGGKRFSRGHLYTLLSNPIYTGQIVHKCQLHPDQQPALIDDASWSSSSRPASSSLIAAPDCPLRASFFALDDTSPGDPAEARHTFCAWGCCRISWADRGYGHEQTGGISEATL